MSEGSSKPFPCLRCKGSMKDSAGVWEVCDGIEIDFCRECNGSGRDLTKPPCEECGAMTQEEAAKKCLCAGDKDDCHGCQIWSDNGGCDPNCGHSDAEHQAFDRGVNEGREKGIDGAENPFDHSIAFAEWDAWESGKSVGAQEYTSAPAGEGKGEG